MILGKDSEKEQYLLGIETKEDAIHQLNLVKYLLKEMWEKSWNTKPSYNRYYIETQILERKKRVIEEYIKKFKKY